MLCFFVAGCQEKNTGETSKREITIKKPVIEKANLKPVPAVKAPRLGLWKHKLSIDARKVGVRKFEVTVNSDLPEGVTLYVYAYRNYSALHFFEAINPQGVELTVFHGNMYSKKVIFKGKEFKETITIDDNVWLKNHVEKMVNQELRHFQLTGLPKGVEGKVGLGVSFVPTDKENQKFKHLFEEKGEKLDGDGVIEQTGVFLLEKEVNVKVPVILQPVTFEPKEVVEKL